MYLKVKACLVKVKRVKLSYQSLITVRNKEYKLWLIHKP